MAFQQGLSGLATASKALDAISNNVSNSGTVGYKQSTAQFADVFAASLTGAGTQVGIGSSVGAVAQQFTQGNINTSSNPLDLALNGQGFFEMQASDGLTKTYSRNGQFQTDKNGYIVNAQGLRLIGRSVDASGKLTGRTEALQLNTSQSDPQATTVAGYSLNFDSRSSTATSLAAGVVTGGSLTGTLTGGGVVIAATDSITFALDGDTGAGVSVSLASAAANSPYASAGQLVAALQSAIDASSLKGRVKVSADTSDKISFTSTRTGRLSSIQTTTVPASLSMPATAGTGSNDAFSINDPSSYTTSTSQTIYDSLGNPHTQTLYFVKTAKSDSGSSVWDVYSSLDGVPPTVNPLATAAAAAGNAAIDPNDRRLASVTFDNTGNFLSLSTLQKDATGAIAEVSSLSPKIAASYDTISTGAVNPLGVTVDFTGTTQFGSNFGINQLTQDGYAPGQLSGLSISADGQIQGNFTNGRSKSLGQIILANFTNPNGLRSLGGNQWAATSAAGQVIEDKPGSGILGVVQSGAVEESNVDLTAELVNMITQQRAYQANAQSIKTEDQVLQTLVNLR